ncbi:MAG TPA: tetratricopeptide repeat protein [Polyangiales bacterium]|nr:tetratricopeptide repeat protein [Polyangiales bacterium]
MTTYRRAIPLIVTVLTMLGSPAVSFAQESEPPIRDDDNPLPPSGSDSEESIDVIEARKLFLEGRELLEKRQLSAACDALERSQKLVPTIGTLLNLGMCHSTAGHFATAHDFYRKAEVLATLQRDPRRREFAHNEAATLAPKRATLTLRITANPDADVDVRVDDVRQPREVWSNPMYMDGGDHWISVEYKNSADAADVDKWVMPITIIDGNKHVLVAPEFHPEGGKEARKAPEHEHAEAPAAAASIDYAVPSAGAATAREDVSPETGLSSTRIVALSVGGAGVAALGASLVFAIMARNAYDESEPDFCGKNNRCSPEGLRLRDDAFADATSSTVFGIVGGAALVGGVVLWFLSAPTSRPSSLEAFKLSASSRAMTAQFTRSF